MPGEDAAVERGVELVLHKLRSLGGGRGRNLLEEGRSVLLHLIAKRHLLWAMTLVGDGHHRAPFATDRSACQWHALENHEVVTTDRFEPSGASQCSLDRRPTVAYL